MLLTCPSRTSRADILVRFDAIGLELLEELGPSPEDAEHRAEDLVAGKGQEISAALPDIDDAMRGLMDGIDRDQASGGDAADGLATSFRLTMEPVPLKPMMATRPVRGRRARGDGRRRAFPRA